jgi:hypothetical protein
VKVEKLELLQKVKSISDNDIAQIIGVDLKRWKSIKTGTTELSLHEMSLLTEYTGVSSGYLLRGKINTDVDKRIENMINQIRYGEKLKKSELKLMQLLDDNNLSEYKDKMINCFYTKKRADIPKRPDYSSIRGLELLKLNNYDLFELLSENYKLRPVRAGSNKMHSNWKIFKQEIIPKHLGKELNDFRYFKYVTIDTPQKAQKYLKYFREGLIQWNSKIILNLINKGAVVIWLPPLGEVPGPGSARSIPDMITTRLLKDYCEKRIGTK